MAMSPPFPQHAPLEGPFVRAQPSRVRSDPFDDQRDALSDACAHRAQRMARSGPVQLVDGRRDEPGAAGTQRMSQGNRTTVGVDARVVVTQTQVAQNGQTLGRKGLVELDHVDLLERDAREREHLADGGRAGSNPMMRGATPAVAMPTTRARGVRPLLAAAASLASRRAQAPSLTPEALPAVTVPSGRTTPLSRASASIEVSCW